MKEVARVMFKSLKFAAVAAIPALALIAAPAQARDGYYRGNRGGDDTAIAIGAGVVGLALGAALASGNRDRDRDYYYDEGYNDPRGFYYPAYPRYYSYNYDYPRYERRGWNGWRGDRHDGWRHDRRGDRGGWGHGPRRWGY